MKKIFFIFIVLFCSAFVLAQSKPLEKSSEIKNGQILELSKTVRVKPRLEMQKAMKLMETFIKKQKIDTSNYYLSQAKLIQYGAENDKKAAWHFWWINVSGSLGDYIEILVFMDGTAGQIPSM